jgi:hypothetical protein
LFRSVDYIIVLLRIIVISSVIIISCLAVSFLSRFAHFSIITILGIVSDRLWIPSTFYLMATARDFSESKVVKV